MQFGAADAVEGVVLAHPVNSATVGTVGCGDVAGGDRVEHRRDTPGETQ